MIVVGWVRWCLWVAFSQYEKMAEEMKTDSVADGALAAPSASEEKRFEIKKWNAVALWSWGTSLWLVQRLKPSTQL